MATALDLHNAQVTHKAAVAIVKADAGPASVGFLELVLPILVPILTSLFAKCFSQTQTGTPQTYLKAQLGADGTFPPSFIQSHRSTGMKAIRISNRNRKPKDRIKPHQVTPEQLDATTTQVFSNILLSSPQAVTSGYAQALAASASLEE